MNVRGARLLVAAFVIAAASLTTSAAVRPPKLQYDISTLPNGLTLVLSEDHSTPIVHLQVWYHVGSKNEKKGRLLREKACDLKDGKSCNDLGTAWSEGKNGAPKPDFVKAKGFYEKACKLADGLGCFNLGNVYRVGEGVKKDVRLAFANFQKSCELDEAKGCTELGIMHYEGTGTPQDADKAIALLEKACKLGSQPACKNVEKIRKK